MEMNKSKPRKLWEHPDPQSTAMWKFIQDSNRRFGLQLNSFQDLYTWSIKHRSDFWGQIWDAQYWLHEGSYTRVVDESKAITQLPRWFEGVRINFAENVLWSRGGDIGRSDERSKLHKEDDRVAITEIREGNTEVRDVTWGELRRRVEELAAALKARGVGKGDRVVIVGGHSSQTVVVMLATMWLGGVFSSSSTDMGVGGLLQRTVQINPKFVFFDDGAMYNGKAIDLTAKIAGMMEGMKACDKFESMVVIQRFAARPYDTSHLERTVRLEDFLKAAAYTPSPPVERVDFQDPCIIYYSSGTTGTPKAIVHAPGPILLNFGKEADLHRDLDHTDVGMQYTTTGWIMYLASVGGLLKGSRAVFYDGSPFIPDLRLLLRITAEQRVTNLGISPRWLGELMKNGVVPRNDFDLSKLKNVVSTGMVLSEQLFEWFYDVAFPQSTHLCNISGGTDIAGCFVCENPLTPVYVGGCQGPSLGVPVAIYDHELPEGSKASPLPPGTPGDLVAPDAFPNIPIFLWNDGDEAPGPKYRSAYFSRFDRAWAQGDFCMVHPDTGNMFMLGRSDGVLNPSGIRFGSSDIYAVLEKHFGQHVQESICVGQRREKDLDERVMLFLLMKEGKKLDAELVGQIRTAIARDLTKRHVPKFIFETPEIPVTVNGKKVELPIKHIVCGRNIKPSGTLLNPQSLDFFYQFQNIEKLTEPQAKL